LVAGGRHGLLIGEAGDLADQSTDVAPGFTRIEPVQTVAGGDTRLAAGAAVEIDAKCKLLSNTGPVGWNQIPVVARLQGKVVDLVTLRKAFDGAQALLFFE